MMTFDKLQPGEVLGSHEFVLNDETAAMWTGLFPDDRACLPIMPPAMVAMVTMRAFMNILKDRPRGNVHAGQKFWITRLPRLNERLTTTFRCAAKQEKNNRRWATFVGDTVDSDQQPLFRAQMTTIWAA